MKEQLKIEDISVISETSEGASSHLPGFDFVLVVILKNAFIAQTQPPRDPLLVLKHTIQEKLRTHPKFVHVYRIDKELKRERKEDIVKIALNSIISSKAKLLTYRYRGNKNVRVCEKNKSQSSKTVPLQRSNVLHMWAETLQCSYN